MKIRKIVADPEQVAAKRDDVSKELGIVIKGLSWGQRMELKQEGIKLERLDPNADNDDVVARVLNMAGLDNDMIGKLTVIIVYELFGEVVRKTFVREEASKNSG